MFIWSTWASLGQCVLFCTPWSRCTLQKNAMSFCYKIEFGCPEQQSKMLFPPFLYSILVWLASIVPLQCHLTNPTRVWPVGSCLNIASPKALLYQDSSRWKATGEFKFFRGVVVIWTANKKVCSFLRPLLSSSPNCYLNAHAQRGVFIQKNTAVDHIWSSCRALPLDDSEVNIVFFVWVFVLLLKLKWKKPCCFDAI